MDEPPPTQHGTLTALPNELLANIFENLNSSSLLALARTCRRIHAISNDHVYAAFLHGNAARLLRTLASLPPDERSHRASQVKTVSWVRTPFQSFLLQCVCAKEWQDIADAFRGLEVENDPMNKTLSKESHPMNLSSHNFFEFFLLFFPRIEKLYVWDALQWDDGEILFANIAANGQRFTRLHHIKMIGPLKLEEMIRLLHLPALHTLDLSQVYNGFQNAEAMRHALHSIASSLEHWTLRNSYLEAENIGAVLDAMPALRSLSYEHMDENIGTVFPRHAIDYDEWLPQLATALSSHDGTLETLCIHMHDTMFTNELLSKALPSLKTLDVSPFQLGYDFDEDLELYCDKFQGVLPAQLQTFNVHFRRPPNTEWLGLHFADHFAKAFAAAVAGTSVKEVRVTTEHNADRRVIEGQPSEEQLTLDMRAMLEVEMERMGIRLLE